MPQLAACALPVGEPTRLAITATDGSTGAIGLATIATRTVSNDLALVSPDPIPYVHGDRVYVVNRYMHDYLDVLEGTSLAMLGQVGMGPVPSGSANPHAIAFDPRGLAYVTLFGAPEVRVLDVSDPAAIVEVDSIDMSADADADGNPELSAAVACGDYLWVSADRLDANASWVPVDTSRLSAIDTTTRRPLPAADGVTPGTIVLQGRGVHKIRLDVRDTTGTTLLVLTSGLERVDVATGEVSWVVADSVFAAAELSSMQLSTFDIAADGRVYFTAASSDWSEYGIWRVGLETGGDDLTQIVSGLNSTTGAMEVIGNEAWFLDTRVGASGVRIFDLGSEPVAEITTTPLSTGLAPYALVALP